MKNTILIENAIGMKSTETTLTKALEKYGIDAKKNRRLKMPIHKKELTFTRVDMGSRIMSIEEISVIIQKTLNEEIKELDSFKVLSWNVTFRTDKNQFQLICQIDVDNKKIPAEIPSIKEIVGSMNVFFGSTMKVNEQYCSVYHTGKEVYINYFLGK